jgi:hypothetical protein
MAMLVSKEGAVAVYAAWAGLIHKGNLIHSLYILTFTAAYQGTRLFISNTSRFLLPLLFPVNLSTNVPLREHSTRQPHTLHSSSTT